MDTAEAQQTLAETRQRLDAIEAAIRVRCPKALVRRADPNDMSIRPLADGEVAFDEAVALARAVVRRALDDLLPTCPIACDPGEVGRARASARKFLLRDLWAPECVWRVFVEEARAPIVAEAKRRIAAFHGMKAVA